MRAVKYSLTLTAHILCNAIKNPRKKYIENKTKFMRVYNVKIQSRVETFLDRKNIIRVFYQ